METKINPGIKDLSITANLRVEPDKDIKLDCFQTKSISTFDPKDYLFMWNVHPMLSSKELDLLAERVKSPKLPDMIFGYNRFFLVFPSKHNLIFEVSPIEMVDQSAYAVRDLIHVDTESKDTEKSQKQDEIVNCVYHLPEEVKIQFYEKWKNLKIPEKTELQTFTPTSDWSYSAAYMGTFSTFTEHSIFKQHVKGNYDVLRFYENAEFGKPNLKRTLTDESIPFERLTQENPVIKYWEIPLFDDELNDNGLSTGNFRVRVMKDCIFGLLRHYLRVDNVIVRIMDTRIFHDLNTNYILRDFQVRESTYDELKSKGFVINSEWSLSHIQSDMVYQYLDEKKHIKDKIEF